MPNYCCFTMQVQGKPENVDEFLKVIKSTYDYEQNSFSYDRHLWRVFSADDTDEGIKNGIKTVSINGDCAWSVYSCMFNGASTYQGDFIKSPEKFYGCNKETVCHGTDIVTESKNLNLAIEIYSEETGMEFQEHYVIINGVIITNDCVHYERIYWDRNEYPTIEELNSEYDTEFTEEMFDEDDYLEIGGFDVWTFSDYTEKIAS